MTSVCVDRGVGEECEDFLEKSIAGIDPEQMMVLTPMGRMTILMKRMTIVGTAQVMVMVILWMQMPWTFL